MSGVTPGNTVLLDLIQVKVCSDYARYEKWRFRARSGSFPKTESAPWFSDQAWFGLVPALALHSLLISELAPAIPDLLQSITKSVKCLELGTLNFLELVPFTDGRLRDAVWNQGP